MLTEDFTFKLGDDGSVLNSDAALPFVDILRVIGLSSTPYRETERQHEGVDGGFMDAEYEEGRRIILEGTVYADPDSMEEFLDGLKFEFAPVQVPIPLYLIAPGRAERVIFVKPLGARYDWDSRRRIGTADIQFVLFAEDPRQYTNTLNTVSIPLGSQAANGFGFNLGFDFGFGAPTFPNEDPITVGGNRPTPPVFEINGPVTGPRIVNLDTSQQLIFDIELGVGDVLEVDVANRLVTLNGISNRRDTLIRDQWFLLSPGTNNIEFRADSGGDSSMDINYRDSWR